MEWVPFIDQLSRAHDLVFIVFHTLLGGKRAASNPWEPGGTSP